MLTRYNHKVNIRDIHIPSKKRREIPRAPQQVPRKAPAAGPPKTPPLAQNMQRP